ncbi:hypothetical protein D3C85_1847330 [compost metagenome]
MQEVLHSADGDAEVDPSREAEIADALNALGEGPAELRQRVIALTIENDALRQHLAALRRQLAEG